MPNKKPKADRLKMDGVDPEDALRGFMQVDPERVKEAEKAAKKKKKRGEK